MITFYQFLESQEPQGTPIVQRAVPLGANSNGGGWKIHLRTGKNDTHRSICYNHERDLAHAILLGIIKHSSKGAWKSKKLTGGDPGDKDITLYCGPKREAIKAAEAIKSHAYLYSLIKPPEEKSEASKDDVLIDPNIPKIYGRFTTYGLNTGDYKFDSYGCKGHPMLASDMRSWTNARDIKKFKNTDFDLETKKEDACKRAFKALTFLFGKDFTGAGEYGQTGSYEEYSQIN